MSLSAHYFISQSDFHNFLDEHKADETGEFILGDRKKQIDSLVFVRVGQTRYESQLNSRPGWQTPSVRGGVQTRQRRGTF